MKFLRLVLFLCVSNCCAYFKLAGPYEATIQDLYECQNVGTHEYQFSYKIKKVNATTKVLLANATYSLEFNEQISYKFGAEMRTFGGWAKNAFEKDGKDVCGNWRDYLWEMFEPWCTGLGVPVQCPIAAGSYSFGTGMPIAYRNLRRFPSLPYGRYKAHLAFYNGDTRIGCVEIKATIDETASTK